MMFSAPDARLPAVMDRLALEWPGGFAGNASAKVRLRLQGPGLLGSLARGQIGSVANAYVRGDIDIDGSLRDLMAVAGDLAGNPAAHDGGPASWLERWLHPLHSRARHLQHRDAQQIQFHYDICDDFFALWLDPLRVYSCAYFEGGPGTALAQAQQAKLDLICRKLQLAPGQQFLDIGAGWGALLLWAAEHHGVQGLGITLSKNQLEHATRLIKAHGLQGRVEMQLLDYRDLPAVGRFDRIASVGMVEHVGEARLDAYFARLMALLRPGGLVLNHGITLGGVDIVQLGAGLGDFIEQHIFPGGELVHVSRVVRSLAKGGLELLDAENLRPHYAQTLWAWSAALERQLDKARALTSEATVRAYRLYLAGSALAFERGWISIYQLLAAKPDGCVEGRAMRGAQSDYPFRRDHMVAPPGGGHCSASVHGQRVPSAAPAAATVSPS